MGNEVIKIENVTKEYRMGIISHGMLYRDIQSWWARLRGKQDPNEVITFEASPSVGDTFLALDDVSFTVDRGEVVGIIGRNGAGKSTLLKIISRITGPTKGRITIDGRVASLLEVGTGFHPELTGRENIYLNGSILGMRKKEINRKFDEIVAFSEVEHFIDTPVKRYSSGMYVRLAFAVAAHLDPEILIVDEVLAVGDIKFQKKCLGKMDEIARRGGRTVLYVSHSMQSVSELCSKAILLDKGAVVTMGPTENVVNAYLSRGSNVLMASRDITDPDLRLSTVSNPDSLFKFTDIAIKNSVGEDEYDILFGEPFEIIFKGCSSEECDDITVGVGISTRRLGYIFSSHQRYNGLPDRIHAGISEYKVRIDPNMLAPGIYDIEIGAVGSAKVGDYIKEALTFQISDVPYDPTMQWRQATQAGLLYYPCKWDLDVRKDWDHE